MARFMASQVDNYGNSGNSSFFSLKNDMDVARVRFMYRDSNDFVGYALHEVEVDGKRRYVNCLREYDDPMHKCPLCASGNRQKAKFYIPLYDVDTKEVKVWERGKNFYGKLAGLFSRYPNLVSWTFDIERHGKKGDTGTTYEIFPVGGQDDTQLEDLPEIPQVLGTIVLDKDAEELQGFVETGTFTERGVEPRRGGYDAPRREEPVREERRRDDYRRTPSRGENAF